MDPKHALQEDKDSITSSRKVLSPKSVLKAFHSTFLRREETRLIPISNDEQRIEGFCKTSLSLFGSYQDTYLALEDTYLSISTNQSKRKSVLKKIQLVQASLEVLSSTKISISDLEGRYWFKFTNGLHCSQWLNSFQSIPGLQKCVEDFYEIGRECGQGRSCVVYECFSKLTGERFALKELIDPFDEIGLIGLHNELHILQILMNHPHESIPRLHDYFRTKSGLQLILEFLPGGELDSKIEKLGALDEDQTRSIFRSVIEGVRHLHENCIAHRDLKPSNIMLSEIPRVIDFDLALVNYSESWFGCHLCGTPEFMAPEILRGETYSLAVDVWSLGCVLFKTLIGCSPFKGTTKQETKSNILNFKLDYHQLEKVSYEARDLILKMLEMCDEERITIQQVLEHPWIKFQN